MFSLLQIDKGIRLILAPKFHRGLSMTNFPITHGMEKLPGSLSFGGILFWIIALHSAVRITDSLSSSFFLLDKISLRNLAYKGICVMASVKGIVIFSYFRSSTNFINFPIFLDLSNR